MAGPVQQQFPSRVYRRGGRRVHVLCRVWRQLPREPHAGCKTLTTLMSTTKFNLHIRHTAPAGHTYDKVYCVRRYLQRCSLSHGRTNLYVRVYIATAEHKHSMTTMGGNERFCIASKERNETAKQDREHDVLQARKPLAIPRHTTPRHFHKDGCVMFILNSLDVDILRKTIPS